MVQGMLLKYKFGEFFGNPDQTVILFYLRSVVYQLNIT